MTVDELVDLVDIYYLENDVWDEEKGQSVEKDILVQEKVFALVGNVSYTSQFKLMEQGFNNVKRIYTRALNIDDTKQIIIKYAEKRYKVVRLNSIESDELEEIFEYDVELMKNEKK